MTPILTSLSQDEESSARGASDLFFSPRTDWTVVILASSAGICLIIYDWYREKALIHPLSPDVRSAAIGAGVFVGILLAAFTLDAWKLGIGIQAPPRGPMKLLSLAALVAACGFGGQMIAGLFAEWSAFHDFRPMIVEQTFTVIDVNRAVRRTDWVDLRADDGTTFSLNCFNDVVGSLRRGDRLLLQVEVGRNGVERTGLPVHAADLKRA